jgi:hypothetical protein
MTNASSDPPALSKPEITIGSPGGEPVATAGPLALVLLGPSMFITVSLGSWRETG